MGKIQPPAVPPAPLPTSTTKSSGATCDVPAAARSKVIPPVRSDQGQVRVSAETLFAQLLNVNPGLFFGDRHGSYNTVEYLSGNMDYFKKQGVTTLYMEMFAADAQPLLDRYFEKGDNVAELEQYLYTQGWHKDLGMDKKYMELVKAARESGIRIVGIDDATSATDPNRLKSSDSHWTQIIQKNSKPTEKYLVFGGQGHSERDEAQCKYGVDYRLGIPALDFYTGEPRIVLGDRFKFDFAIYLERSPHQPPDPLGKGR